MVKLFNFCQRNYRNSIYFSHANIETITIGRNGTTFIPKGAVVRLLCEFEKKVDCGWSRRGFHLEIGNRYTYMDSRNGIQTTNCSIEIKGFDDTIDNGEWDCKSLADSSSHAIQSTIVYLFTG